MKKNPKITPANAANLMGVGTQAIRQGLKSGKFPFGVAFLPDEDSQNWSYYISPVRFMQYTGIKKSAIERECGLDLSDYREPRFITFKGGEAFGHKKESPGTAIPEGFKQL